MDLSPVTEQANLRGIAGIPASPRAHGYADYIQLAALLDLQSLRSSKPRSELLFIVVHQVYELWFKVLLAELECAIAAIDADDGYQALRAMRRVHDLEGLMLAQALLIHRMEPGDFSEIREGLGSSSAAESVQFAAIEALSCSSEGEDARSQYKRDLWSALCECIERCGMTMPRDATSSASEMRLASLERIYMDRGVGRGFLKDLCESMLDHDEAFILWRQRHVLMAQRHIGARPGTGGSSGVSHLETRASRKFYPDLWAVRNVFLAASKLAR
ncbi:MAG TPA: tryptophan 2,3-dioxygenase family protein [Steroidobacteraceae bacterium]|nr:tryptophan 2,3-dioxygenase family protein [Steroidobacteraceae bacterium]